MHASKILSSTRLNVELINEIQPVDYDKAMAQMDRYVQDVIRDPSRAYLWFLEHPPTITAGTSSLPNDLLAPDALPVFHSTRGGQYTYHGPGQRVVYFIVALKPLFDPRPVDIRVYVKQLEEWIIRALALLSLEGFRRDKRIGIWTTHRGADHKIAALGVRVRHGVAYHGIAVNCSVDLTHFSYINPCGLSTYGVTSLHDMGHTHLTMQMLDEALIRAFHSVFLSD